MGTSSAMDLKRSMLCSCCSSLLFSGSIDGVLDVGRGWYSKKKVEEALFWRITGDLQKFFRGRVEQVDQTVFGRWEVDG